MVSAPALYPVSVSARRAVFRHTNCVGCRNESGLCWQPRTAMPDGRNVHIPKHVCARVLDGETILLNLNTGAYFKLNETGTQIWSLLAQGRALADIRQELRAQFDAQPD